MASRQEFSDFFIGIEKRAYKQALFAVHDEQAALDIVQDAMMKLTEKYADKPFAELPPLFQRILQNTIRDHYRRQKTQSIWMRLFSSFASHDDAKEYEESDLLETLPISKDSGRINDPHAELEQAELILLIENALKTLSVRQREAFLLRYWEGMDVSETAKAMGCSEGSVKTHCSRAAHSLATILKEKGVKL